MTFRSLVISTVALALALAPASRAGTLYTHPAQIPPAKHYDFIVVGGGTAGGVVATRLAQYGTGSVLVIEAGVPDNGTQSASIYCPLLAGSAVGTIYDWNFTTVAQPGLNGREIGYPRGYTLGGSAALNGLIYFRGPKDEYSRLANVSGDPNWTWDNLEPYIFMNEAHSPPWNNRSNVGEYDPAAHGWGPLLTGLTATVLPTDTNIMKVVDAHPESYSFNLDLNSGDGLGFGWLSTTVGKGSRSNSANAYLHPALNTRHNLDVLLHSHVTKVVPTPGKARHTFTTVEVSTGTGSKSYSFTACKEVVLSAGSVGTPQLLMLSGIGPSEQLNKFGIETIVDHPDVGQNLQDQTILALQWEVDVNTLSSFLADAVATEDAVVQWATNKTGTAAGNTVVNTIGFVRLPEDSPLLADGDPAAGPQSAHFQMAFLNTFYPNDGQTTPAGNFLSICVVLQSPTSRGSVNLTSASPWDHPAIDPNYFATDFDIGTVVASMKAAIAFMSQPEWDGVVVSTYPEVAALKTDADFEAYARKYATTLKHPTSTAKISKESDADGVVSPRLRVKGVKGLRVIDASVLPSAVAGYPQGEVYIIAERGAELIKEAWKLPGVASNP